MKLFKATERQKNFIYDLIEQKNLQFEIDNLVEIVSFDREKDIDDLTLDEASSLINYLKDA